jgi:hypothetical protein
MGIQVPISRNSGSSTRLPGHQSTWRGCYDHEEAYPGIYGSRNGWAAMPLTKKQAEIQRQDTMMDCPWRQVVSVQQNLQGLKIRDRLAWAQNACSDVDTYSSISQTGIDEIKDLSIISIHIIFVMFTDPRPNILLHQGEVIPVTKR